MKKFYQLHRQQIMMKRILLSLFALLPIALQAQTEPEGTTFVSATSKSNIILVKDNASGLEYLYDSTDPNGLFIDVGSSSLCIIKNTNSPSNAYFMKDAGLRPNWRQNYNANNARWYKTALDSYSIVDKGNKGPVTYKGVEYFRNITTLKVTATSTLEELDLSKNTKLTTVNFASNNLTTLVLLDISNTKLSSIPLSGNLWYYITNLYANNCPNLTSSVSLQNAANLRVAEFENSPITALTLPTAKGKLEALNLSGTHISTLNVTDYNVLSELKLNNCHNFTSGIGLPSQTMCFRLLELQNTNLGRFYTHATPLDLTSYPILLSLEGILVFDNEGGDGFIAYYNENLQGENPDGNILIHNNYLEEYTYAPVGHVESIDFSEDGDFYMPRLKKLHVIGDVDLVIIPSDRTVFDITAENAPNLTVDLSTQTRLKELFVEDVPTLDVSGCTALQKLAYTGPESKNLILSENNTAITDINLSYSGIEEFDISGGIIPNLTTLRTSFSLLKKLNVSDHTKLANLILIPNESERPEEMSSKEWSELFVLEELNISGCTALPERYNPSFSDDWKYFCNLKKVIARNCRFSTFQLYNSLIEELDLSNNSNLSIIQISQGKLIGKNGDIKIDNCPMISNFTAHRHHWESLDFLLVPSEHRLQEHIDMLEVLQVNGGTYTIRNELTKGGTTLSIPRSDDLIYTTRLRELNLNYVKQGVFRKLLCEDNLLTQLDLTHIGPYLRYLMCARNMLTTLDLHMLPKELTTDDSEKTGPIKLFYQSNWSPQVGYISTEIIRAQGSDEDQDNIEAVRRKDWLALLMVNGGYTHKFDNEVKLYPNLYHARNNGTAITTESNPWMCTVAQANSIDKFSGCNFDASRYDENQQYLFIHSAGTLIDEQGWKDHELDGKVVIGKFNTGFNQNVDENNVPILGSNGEIEPVNTATAEFPNTLCKPHIEVRMHLWPHILTINPATNALNTVTNKKAGYYSSTLILDYDAMIPEGVQCYFIEGLMTKKIESNENVNVMFKTALFGKGGNEEGVNHVLPANTPVYIRSDKDPGLYDFQPLWEFDYLGWENLRGTDFCLIIPFFFCHTSSGFG